MFLQLSPMIPPNLNSPNSHNPTLLKNYISLSHTTHVTIGPSSFLELPDGSTTTKLCLVQPFSKIGPGLDTSHTTAHKLAWEFSPSGNWWMEFDWRDSRGSSNTMSSEDVKYSLRSFLYSKDHVILCWVDS